ncbi:hypothetical protein HNR46_004254 [Haloferula luteola]|uniref:Uncharacterized protein n=1 Tax=Haloferula luteola TaxID=595692 RepID=A0A840V8C9_9BACT|nr:hypothetical protein [Haloferula luteola]
MDTPAMAATETGSNALDPRQKSVGFPTDFKQTDRQ